MIIQRIRTAILSLIVAANCIFPCAAAQREPDDLVGLFSKANPAVVVISAYSSSGTTLSQGSGFIVSSDGLVVTNNHVIVGGEVIIVRRPTADPVFATEVRVKSDEWDLAILKIKGKHLPSLTLASRGYAKVGMRVVAIGSPFGLENTISEGIISGIRGDSVLQVTTPLSPGSSGGALLGIAGSVLGATTLTLQGGQNVNFAVSADQISKLLRVSRDHPAQRYLRTLDNVPNPRSERVSDSPYYRAYRTFLEASCPDITSVDAVIAQAISAGAPVYNDGSRIGCYRIYEGAAYKLLYLLDGKCNAVEVILLAGLAQAQTDSTAIDKAWTMRRTFDLILGEQTRTN